MRAAEPLSSGGTISSLVGVARNFGSISEEWKTRHAPYMIDEAEFVDHDDAGTLSAERPGHSVWPYTCIPLIVSTANGPAEAWCHRGLLPVSMHAVIHSYAPVLDHIHYPTI